MNKPTLLFLAALAGYTCAGCNPGNGNSVMPREDTWDRTLGFLLYVEAHVTPSEVQANSPNYAFVWNVWNGVNWADDFRATNSQSNLGWYTLPFVDEQDGRPDPLPPGGDTPESRQRTLQWWMFEADGTGHPDWILYRCDGVTPAYFAYDPPNTSPNMPLDFTNPAVVDWQLRAALDGVSSTATALSFDFFSPANLSHACGVYRDGQWVQLFTGGDIDVPYHDAVFAWAREARRRLADQPYPKGVVVNCPPVPAFEEPTIVALGASVDGVLDEYGFTYYDEDTRDVWWPIKIRRMIELQNAGLAYYSVNYIERFPPTQEELNWILGSFLMAREHSAYIVITEQPTETYLYPTWPHLPEYDVSVGHPCAEMTMSQGVYVRDFSKGLVLVNPSRSDSFTVTLPPGNFTDLDGGPLAGNVLLAPLAGKVLVSSQDRCR
jgi:hypothetical protein